jgi:hypothetical protein
MVSHRSNNDTSWREIHQPVGNRVRFTRRRGGRPTRQPAWRQARRGALSHRSIPKQRAREEQYRPDAGRKRYDDRQGHRQELQLRVKVWRATEGPSRKVCFQQEHTPGRIN